MIMVLMQGEHKSVVAGAAVTALGVERNKALGELVARASRLDALTADVSTQDVVLRPMKGRTAKEWEKLALQRGERWVFIAGSDDTTLAVDEPSSSAMLDPAAAVIYPELHTRLVSWWLVHAWRGIDLIKDTVDSLRWWRITSSAVTARALLEEAGALAEEALRLTDGWKVGKATPADPLKRPEAVRGALASPLLHAGFGSRMKISIERLQATNVLTLVQKLARSTGDERLTTWYDWLSDAAHPAYGARIAFASPPFLHESRAVMIRWYARSPLSLQTGDARQPLEPTIALTVADTLIAAGRVITDVLDQSLAVVDDVGLTTAAATLTDRIYWRNLSPVRGKRRCPCGRGPASRCGHQWGQPAPAVTIPRTASAA
jgi:hypothetical protein